MTKEIAHSLILIVCIVISFIFAKTGLRNYDLQLAAILFIIFFISKKYFLAKQTSSRLLESVIFTLIILITINTTGGIASPFFFLVYFLLFSLSLLLEPVISITVSMALIILYLLEAPANQNLNQLIPIFSLAFLTPFALFLGQEYDKNLKLKAQSAKLQQTITQTQEDSFLFLSLILKNHIKSIKSAVENFMGDHDLHQIKNNVKRMEKAIEDYEKNS